MKIFMLNLIVDYVIPSCIKFISMKDNKKFKHRMVYMLKLTTAHPRIQPEGELPPPLFHWPFHSALDIIKIRCCNCTSQYWCGTRNFTCLLENCPRTNCEQKNYWQRRVTGTLINRPPRITPSGGNYKYYTRKTLGYITAVIWPPSPSL